MHCVTTICKCALHIAVTVSRDAMTLPARAVACAQWPVHAPGDGGGWACCGQWVWIGGTWLERAEHVLKRGGGSKTGWRTMCRRTWASWASAAPSATARPSGSMPRWATRRPSGLCSQVRAWSWLLGCIRLPHYPLPEFVQCGDVLCVLSHFIETLGLLLRTPLPVMGLSVRQGTVVRLNCFLMKVKRSCNSIVMPWLT